MRRPLDSIRGYPYEEAVNHMDTYEELYADYYHESGSDYSEYDYDDYDYDDDYDPFKRSL